MRIKVGAYENGEKLLERTYDTNTLQEGIELLQFEYGKIVEDCMIIAEEFDSGMIVRDLLEKFCNFCPVYYYGNHSPVCFDELWDCIGGEIDENDWMNLEVENYLLSDDGEIVIILMASKEDFKNMDWSVR